MHGRDGCCIAMVNIEINGAKIQARQGMMVIEAADEAGITIPRFCFHKKLSIAANCRMCLVEIEKVGKPVPACATPVTDGMRIFTMSAKALDAQKGVMEFLLINHPLDCPICDQGGECDLQDIAMGFGKDISRFTEDKRVVASKNLGPLIATDMTRCIHCTRCVRFGQEIAGIMELGGTGRGEHVRIGTYVGNTVDSEMSGNMIDLCPVGALTSKPYRFTGRPWENQQFDSIAPHDCMGSNLQIEVRRNHVMRVLPKENEAINETWLSDRDRFSYDGLYSEDRLQSPMIKQGNEWREVDWPDALNYAVQGIKTVIETSGADQFGSLVSSSATVEEMFLLQKLTRALGSQNIDHRTRQMDFSDQDIAPAYPSLGLAIQDLELLDAVLLIGSNVRKDQPIAAHRLRKAALDGANIMAVNSVDYDFNFPLAAHIVSSPAVMAHNLAAVCKALLTMTGGAAPSGLAALLENVEAHDVHLEMAKHLYAAKKSAVLIGMQALNQPELSVLRALANVIAELCNASIGYLTAGANSAGAWLAGAIPHRGPAGEASTTIGKDAANMCNGNIKGLLLLGLEPEHDCADPAAAMCAVTESDFVVSLTPYVTEAMKAYADVLLPITPFTETSGTYVNVEGAWQSFSGSVRPMGEARPTWKVLRVLGNIFNLDGFGYMTSEEIRDELKTLTENVSSEAKSAWRCPDQLPTDSKGLMRIGHLPIYAVDALVRRSQPLQATADASEARLYINTQTAAQIGLNGAAQATASQGEGRVSLPVVIDDAVPDACVVIPSGLAGCQKLGAAYGPVQVNAD